MPFLHRSRALARLAPASLAALVLALSAPGVVLAQAKAPQLSLSDAIARTAAFDPSTAGAQARITAARAGNTLRDGWLRALDEAATPSLQRF